MPKLVKAGEKIELEVLVQKFDKGTAKNGKAFANLVLRDKEESFDGKVWDWIEEYGEFVKKGVVLLVKGTMDEYNGKRQLIVNSFVPSDSEPESFYRRTAFDVDMMWGDLVEKVASFKEPMTRYVAEELLIKNAAVADLIKKAPAASKVHNNWFGGLLEHIWSLTQIAEPLIQHYKDRYEPLLSREKILFGLMLHDAGKIVEYNCKDPEFAHTTVGTLTNHIVLGIAWIHEKCNDFSRLNPTYHKPTFQLERAHLCHLVAAHHGCLEWGSPVKPSTLEALLVHQLDLIDSKFLHAWDMTKTPSSDNPSLSNNSYFEKTKYLIPSTLEGARDDWKVLPQV